MPSACAPAVTPRVVKLHFDETGRVQVEPLSEQAEVSRQMTVVDDLMELVLPVRRAARTRLCAGVEWLLWPAEGRPTPCFYEPHIRKLSHEDTSLGQMTEN